MRRRKANGVRPSSETGELFASRITISPTPLSGDAILPAISQDALTADANQRAAGVAAQLLKGLAPVLNDLHARNAKMIAVHADGNVLPIEDNLYYKDQAIFAAETSNVIHVLNAISAHGIEQLHHDLLRDLMYYGNHYKRVPEGRRPPEGVSENMQQLARPVVDYVIQHHAALSHFLNLHTYDSIRLPSHRGNGNGARSR
jgi:hypothetical protein